MRKELTIYIPTTVEVDDLAITTTSQGDTVVLVLPNGHKVGISNKHLYDALFDLRLFKNMEKMGKDHTDNQIREATKAELITEKLADGTTMTWGDDE